jgi:hypothetical protein
VNSPRADSVSIACAVSDRVLEAATGTTVTTETCVTTETNGVEEEEGDGP